MKWPLSIPHVIGLVFLGIAFVVVSIVAFVAILFTERYLRRLFDFSLGVLRWTWRVAFYSYSALGTDRYPPFTLILRGAPLGEGAVGPPSPSCACARSGRAPARAQRWPR